ncbi:hypothetical protein CA267_018740 [Alteromonas pelagimontana]|uniref:Uncharacterized protein n=1 Tax=Alteromonas pelagimontana TaxID=1858656 RepID=A0A6M4MHZ6_9ALTE|nr:hypothetical protein [Alteromonas pelagimontana]QJR82642.1 hypothetical protein CA267_018740 [Alteromonas pelagimontana]
MINNESVVRSCNLLNAVHELHKEGFQHLAVYCYFEGTNWAATLLPAYDLSVMDGELIVLPSLSGLHHKHVSKGRAGTFFAWDDVAISNPYTLTRYIKSRFGKLLEACKGDNFAFVGWYAKLVGKADTGLMPIMKKRATAIPHTVAIHEGADFPLPPVQRVQMYNNQLFVVDKAPHLLSQNEDWHFGHKSRIDSFDFKQNTIIRVPEYPYWLKSELEMSAYWEGAIYYAQVILKVESISDFLRQLGKEKSHTSAWKWFVKIYDSHGQLDYFVAFLLSLQMKGASALLPISRKNNRIRWLTEFESRIKERQCIHSSHNPYVGVENNPLHLGLILADYENHWLV